MKITCLVGFKKFELVTRSTITPSDVFYQFNTITSARTFISRIMESPGKRESLRRLCFDTELLPINRLDDHEIIDRISKALLNGRIRVIPSSVAGHEGRWDNHVSIAPDESSEETNDTTTATGAATGATVSNKTWIEIELLDEEGQPVVNEPYKLILPDGSVKSGKTDSAGMARYTELDDGNCQLTFTKIDKEAWARS